MSRILKMRNNGRRRGGNEFINIPMARDELDCMPSAISKHEEQHNQENGNIQQNQQWQRRLSPLKRRPSFFGRAGTSSSSSSPQRRLSPERKWWPPLLLPLLSKSSTTNGNEKIDENGALQEAWESLKNGGMRKRDGQSNDDLDEYGEQQIHDNKARNGESTNRRLSSSSQKQKNKNNSTNISLQKSIITSPPTTSINCDLPPKCTKSTSRSKTSEMNGPNTPKPQPKHRQKLKQLEKCAEQTEQNDEDDESMSTSILASAAWYRDSKGRTGYRPQSDSEQLLAYGSRVQNSPVKMLSNKTQSLSDAHSVLQNGNNDKPFFNNNFPPQILRHTSTHPNTLFDDQNIFNHFLYHSNIRGEHSSPPRMLRRTNKSKELIKEDKNDLNDYFNLFKEENFKTKNNLNNSPIEEMERLTEQLKHSKSDYKHQQSQKMVKFAETVEINEIEKFEGSSTSSNNSCSSSSSTSSTTFQPVEFFEDDFYISNGQLLKKETPLKTEENKKEERKRLTINGTIQRQKEEMNKSSTCGSSKLNSPDVGHVIEQFFNHCHSISSINKQPKQQQKNKDQQQILPLFNDKIANNSNNSTPIEQRSFYDNLAEDNEDDQINNDKQITKIIIKNDEKEVQSSNNWLHTKAKVIAQQNCGPLEWRRDGSPRRRVQMLITCDREETNLKSSNVPLNSILQRKQEISINPSTETNTTKLSRIPLNNSSVTTSTSFNNNTITRHLPRQNNHQILINGDCPEVQRNKRIKTPSYFIAKTKNTQNWPPNF